MAPQMLGGLTEQQVMLRPPPERHGTARHGTAPRTRSPHLGLQTHPPRSQQRHQGGSAVPAGWQQLRPEGCAGVGYGPAAGRGGSCVSRSLSPRPAPAAGPSRQAPRCRRSGPVRTSAAEGARPKPPRLRYAFLPRVRRASCGEGAGY